MRRAPLTWAAPVLYLALACALVVPAAARGLPGAAPDAGSYVWWLQWVPHALHSGSNPLHSDALLAPGGVNAMWNTSILLPGLLLSPITVLAGPVVSYDVLIVLAPALSAWVAWLAVRRLVQGDAAAFTGGLLYGFSPYVVAHSLGHPNLSIAVFPPLVLLLIDRILRGGHPQRDGVLLGIAAAAQLLTGEEMLLSTAVAAAICLAVLALQHRDIARAHLPALLHGLGAAAIVFALFAAAPLAYQFAGPDRVQGRVQQSIFGNDLDAFYIPSSLQLFAPQAALDRSAGFATFPGVPVEVNAYIGVPLLLLLVAAPRLLRRNQLVRFALPCAATLAVLSLGSHVRHGGMLTSIPLPWLAADHVPLLQDVLPTRLMVHVFLLVALVAATAVARASTLRPQTRGLALLAITVSLLALVPRTLPSQSAATPRFFTGAARTLPAGTVVLVAPWADLFDTRAMVWQAQARMQFRMPEGFAFGAGPIDQPQGVLESALGSVDRGAELVPLGPNLRAALNSELVRFGIRDVVATTSAEVRLLTDLLRRAPQQIEGVSLWERVRP